MKRHISIFTFLLGAFAAGLASEVRADQTVYGGFHYIGETYQSRSIERMTVNGSKTSLQAVLARNATATNAVNEEPEGTKVSDWGYVEGDSGTKIQTFKNLTWEGDGSREYVWKNETDSPDKVAIAVRFDYIKYNVTYDENGGSPKPQVVVNQSYDTDFSLAKAPVKTGFTFSRWKASTNGESFEAGASINGEQLGLADCHVDGSNVTMMAQWATNGYSVGCELNGGAWSAGYNPPARVTYDQVFSLPAPTRIGYDFIGWKVTSGLDITTAKWGTDKNPSTSIMADKPCFNDEKDVFFKNINPTNDAVVALTAQWQAKMIRVTFNNEGGSSGGGILDYLDVTYGNAYPALNVPSQGGNLFRGYVIDGTEYWNEKAQPTKLTWDIPTNCTAHAQWEKVDYQLIYDENRSDGSVSKQVSRTFEYGVPTLLYDGADFSNLGCTLLGWSTLKQAEKPDAGCEIGASKTFVSPTTLYAVWEKNYFIVYDGNGATNETPMAVQKFVFGKSGQSLNPNIYGKVGYTFDGWATNRAAALLLKREYEDRAILTRDPAKTLGETNTLFAVWATNIYYVAFDMNGGSDVAPDVLPCAYDNPVDLTWTKKDGSEFTNGAYDFLGWSNDVAKVIYTNREESVSNLCATAKGTNTLHAVWKISDLSAAMHCTTLRWKSIPVDSGRINAWEPAPTGAGARQYGERSRYQEWLVAQVPTNGTLSFVWRPVACDGDKYLTYWISATTNETPSQESVVNLKGNMDEWNSCVIEDVPANQYVLFYVSSTWELGYCDIDQMTWIPEGSEPKYVDVDSPVTGFSMVDGKLVFAFDATNDEASAYHLLGTNDLVAPMPWPMVFEIGKPSGPFSFEIPVKEDEPKMFYRIRALK